MAHYYVVGGAIEDLCGGFLTGGARPRAITQNELEKFSLYNQTNVRLFASKVEATAYALSLRTHSLFPKTAVSNSRVNPIFTIELPEHFLTMPQCRSTAIISGGEIIRRDRLVERPRPRAAGESTYVADETVVINYYDINPKMIS